MKNARNRIFQLFFVLTFVLAGIVTNSEKRRSWSFSVFPKSKNLYITILLNGVISWKYPKTSRDVIIFVYFSFFSQSPRFIWYLRKKALLPYSKGYEVWYFRAVVIYVSFSIDFLVFTLSMVIWGENTTRYFLDWHVFPLSFLAYCMFDSSCSLMYIFYASGSTVTFLQTCSLFLYVSEILLSRYIYHAVSRWHSC